MTIPESLRDLGARIPIARQELELIARRVELEVQPAGLMTDVTLDRIREALHQQTRQARENALLMAAATLCRAGGTIKSAVGDAHSLAAEIRRQKGAA